MKSTISMNLLDKALICDAIHYTSKRFELFTKKEAEAMCNSVMNDKLPDNETLISVLRCGCYFKEPKSYLEQVTKNRYLELLKELCGIEM